MLKYTIFKFVLFIAISVTYSGAEPDGDDGDHDHVKFHSICDLDVDVGFILDSSGSIRYHFRQQKKLVKRLHAELAKNIAKLRCGVMTFSDRTIYYRNLRFYSPRYFNLFIDRMVLQDKTTRIDKAMKFAFEKLFLVANGHRPGAIKVAILLTDGRQTNGNIENPAATIEEMRSNGIFVIVIGVVDTDKEALEKLDAGTKKLLYAGSLTRKDNVILQHIPRSCREEVCNIGYEPMKPTCDYIIDIMFVVDSSGSLRGYFEAEKYFIKSIAEQFDISRNNSRVSFVRFSHIVKTEIHFTDFTDMHKFHEAVDDIFYDGGLTRIDLGLRNAEIEFKKPQNIASLNNPKVSKYLVLLTDGRQNAEDPNPAIVAQRIRNMGVKIIVIGVGREIDVDQMKEIADGGGIWHESKSFDDLINLHNIKLIKSLTCHGLKRVVADPDHEDEEDHHSGPGEK